MKKKFNYIIVLLLIIFCFQDTSVLAAVNSNPYTIKIKSSGKTLKDFIPSGWKVISKATGDLNKDKLIDIAVVMEYTKKVKDDGEEHLGQPRALFIVFKKKDGSYQLSVQSNDIILLSFEGGVYGDPFQGIKYNRGSIIISSYGGSGWRWGSDLRFRYQDNDWYLIGDTELTEHLYTGESETVDTNLLTGDQIVTVINKKGKKSVCSGNIGKEKLKKLTDFHD